jgi:hypothetical protein
MLFVSYSLFYQAQFFDYPLQQNIHSFLRFFKPFKKHAKQSELKKARLIFMRKKFIRSI